MNKTIRNSKLGQMKIQQTAFMLIALTLFFVLVGLFILSFVLTDNKGTAARLNEKEARLLVSKLANSPELSCGESFGRRETDCVDFDKVMALKQIGVNYQELWGIKDIKIRKIYPEQDDVSCTDGNFPNCKTLHLFQESLDGTYVSNYVSLCRKASVEGYYYDHCEIAHLMISYGVPE